MILRWCDVKVKPPRIFSFTRLCETAFAALGLVVPTKKPCEFNQLSQHAERMTGKFSVVVCHQNEIRLEGRSATGCGGWGNVRILRVTT